MSKTVTDNYDFNTEVPPEIVALGDSLGQYFREHADEFKEGARIAMEVDFGEFIDIQMFVEIPPILAIRLRLDNRGEWHVLEYNNPTVYGA